MEEIAPMNADQSPFSAGWISVEMPGVRDCGTPYCLTPYESLPDVTGGDTGSFGWLAEADDHFSYPAQLRRFLAERLDTLMLAVGERGLALPEPFVTFMSTPRLYTRVRSATACYFDLPRRVVAHGETGGLLIRFLDDPRDMMFWYLYLDGRGDACVVASQTRYTPDSEGADHAAETLFCAPSFDVFIRRFCLESEIAFHLKDSTPLSQEGRRYLEALTPVRSVEKEGQM
jgi:hypothetical protein